MENNAPLCDLTLKLMEAMCDSQFEKALDVCRELHDELLIKVTMEEINEGQSI